MKVTMKHSHGSVLALFVLTGCWLALCSNHPARAQAEEPSAKPSLDACKDGRRDAVDVCWDAFEPAEWGKMTQCLQDALKREETALADELKKATQQAAQSLDKLSAAKTLQESNAQWIKYRDAECTRRQAFVAGRNHPDIGELTCQIRETAERIADLRFDE